MPGTKITPTNNGPLRIEGDFEILDPQGKAYRAFVVPLRPFGEQALLRRHAQQDRFPERGAGPRPAAT